MKTANNETTAENLGLEAIESFRRDGFVRVRGLIPREEAERFRKAALDACSRLEKGMDKPVFTQVLNVWRNDPVMKQLTLHPNLGAMVEKLAGGPMRLWHDHLLIKQPNNKAPTAFHQDQSYEPLAETPFFMTAWIALCDVPVERGCMTFIPGAHHYTNLARLQPDETGDFLLDDEYLFRVCPELRWYPRVTLPLQAGDCTFHRGYTPHRAGPNTTTEPRIPHVVLFANANAVFTGDKAHPVSDPLKMKPGQQLDSDMFPEVREFAAKRFAS